MKSYEFLTEAYIDPEITEILVSKGYKQLGKGVDQIAFLEPKTGLILKIFGTNRTGSSTTLTKAQKSFKTFYELSKADPDNEFLPNIVGYETFVFKGRPYLQIRMERLFEFEGPGIWAWPDILSNMAIAIDQGKTFDTFWSVATEPTNDNMPDWAKQIRNHNQAVMQQVIMHVGEEGLIKLWDTIVMLKEVAKKNNYMLDLHGGNFMLGSDGTPVITDPFFMGE